VEGEAVSVQLSAVSFRLPLFLAYGRETASVFERLHPTVEVFAER
jgi:hypothetical protein